jgi:hypothetical protein
MSTKRPVSAHNGGYLSADRNQRPWHIVIAAIELAGPAGRSGKGLDRMLSAEVFNGEASPARRMPGRVG